jgi:hypothetical protein
METGLRYIVLSRVLLNALQIPRYRVQIDTGIPQFGKCVGACYVHGAWKGVQRTGQNSNLLIASIDSVENGTRNTLNSGPVAHDCGYVVIPVCHVYV